jgi:N-acetylneuraminic acid mutarotase
VINNTLLIHGGKKDTTYSYSSAPNIAELLSLDLSSSFSLSSPPWILLNTTNAPSVAFHTLTPYSGNQLLLFGGDPGPSVALSTQNDSAALLDLTTGGTGTWTVPTDGWASEPMRRQYHSATPCNSQVIIIGGEKVDGSDYGFNESYLFSPNPTSTPIFSQINGNMPSDFVGHATVTLPNGTLLIIGGYSYASQSLLSLQTLYTLNTASGTWGMVETAAEPTATPSTTTTPPEITPTTEATPTAEAPPSSETWPATNTSQDTTPYDGDGIPTRRRNFAAVLVGDDQVLIHGGADAALQQAIGDAFILNLSSWQWKELPTLGQALGDRWGHTAVASGTSVLFAFGQ